MSNEVPPGKQEQAKGGDGQEESHLSATQKGWDVAFHQNATRRPEGENVTAGASLDPYGLKKALAQVDIVMTDGEVVNILESLGKDTVKGRVDFGTFVELCRSRHVLQETRAERNVETKAAFEAMGGEGGKVETLRLKEVLESFEMLEVANQCMGVDNNGVCDFDRFSEFLRAENEDIDLDSNLHSTGEGWLRRDTADVRKTLKDGKVNIRQLSGHTATKEGVRQKAKAEADDWGAPTVKSDQDWHRLAWLEKLQSALTAKERSEAARREERHRKLNTMAAGNNKSSYEESGDSHPMHQTAPAKLLHGEKSQVFGKAGSKAPLKKTWKV